MGELRLFAIGIDEVRDLFGAGEATQLAFRTAVAAAFPPAPVAPHGLLSKLGPLLKRPPDAPVIRPEVPVEADVATILAGRFVRPERLPAAWRLIDTWLAATCWAEQRLDIDAAQFNDVDFDLARAGVSPRFSLGQLLNGALRLPLTCPAGLATGYVGFDHVVAMADAWRDGFAALSDEHQASIGPLLSWFERFSEFASAASAAGRPAPDLVALYRQGGRPQ